MVIQILEIKFSHFPADKVDEINQSKKNNLCRMAGSGI